MGFLWRRRSSVVKIVILLSAVWFTIVFLIYSEDRNRSTASGGGASGSGGSGIGGHHNLPPALSLKSDLNNEIEPNDVNNDINGLESVINNVVFNGLEKEHHSSRNVNHNNRADGQRNGSGGASGGNGGGSGNESGMYCAIFFFKHNIFWMLKIKILVCF